MKITAVSGYKAVGRNMTGVGVGKETVAIDNGIRLDTLQMYDGDINLLKNKSLDELISLDIIPHQARLKNVSAQLISHGHLDHIGALPINKPKVPIVSTHYTIEQGKKEYTGGDFYSVGFNEVFEVSRNLSVEFLEVTHSIPYASIVVLHTPEGDVVYASDFRLDNHSLVSKPDYKGLKKIAGGNPRALIVESTRVQTPGKTPSESVVRAKLSDVLEFIDSGLIVATTFSTHIERIQCILDAAEKAGRIPLVMGRSFSRQIGIAERFGILNLPPNARVYATPKAIKRALEELKRRDDYFLLVTGHQGEPNSVISKITDGRLPFKFQRGDSMIFCANTIPTPLNYATRYVLETRLKSAGVKIFDNIHVSGHAAREDHRYLLNLLKPEHVIPCHGDFKMRGSYATLAMEEGYELNKNIHLLTNGGSVDI